MASLFKLSLIFILFAFFLHINTVTCTEFEVGGDDHGWAVPKAKEGHLMYNKWASDQRFKIGDTLQFKYKKDSVMAVTEEEYKKCRSWHPLFYSNNGETVYNLIKPGLFYFISGVSGHCERGLRMIIKVLETASPSDHYQNQTTMPPPSKNDAAAIASPTILSLIMLGFLLY